MLNCPECGGKVQTIGSDALFCLDCDWDNLEPLSTQRRQHNCKHVWALRRNENGPMEQWCIHCHERRILQPALMFLRP